MRRAFQLCAHRSRSAESLALLLAGGNLSALRSWFRSAESLALLRHEASLSAFAHIVLARLKASRSCWPEGTFQPCAHGSARLKASRSCWPEGTFQPCAHGSARL